MFRNPRLLLLAFALVAGAVLVVLLTKLPLREVSEIQFAQTVWVSKVLA